MINKQFRSKILCSVVTVPVSFGLNVPAIFRGFSTSLPSFHDKLIINSTPDNVVFVDNKSILILPPLTSSDILNKLISLDIHFVDSDYFDEIDPSFWVPFLEILKNIGSGSYSLDLYFYIDQPERDIPYIIGDGDIYKFNESPYYLNKYLDLGISGYTKLIKITFDLNNEDEFIFICLRLYLEFSKNLKTFEVIYDGVKIMYDKDIVLVINKINSEYTLPPKEVQFSTSWGDYDTENKTNNKIASRTLVKDVLGGHKRFYSTLRTTPAKSVNVTVNNRFFSTSHPSSPNTTLVINSTPNDIKFVNGKSILLLPPLISEQVVSRLCDSSKIDKNFMIDNLNDDIINSLKSVMDFLENGKYDFVFYGYISSPVLWDFYNFEYLSKERMTFLRGNFGYCDLLGFVINVDNDREASKYSMNVLVLSDLIILFDIAFKTRKFTPSVDKEFVLVISKNLDDNRRDNRILHRNL